MRMQLDGRKSHRNELQLLVVVSIQSFQMTSRLRCITASCELGKEEMKEIVAHDHVQGSIKPQLG